MTTGTFFAEKLDWHKRGYFAAPTPRDDPGRAADPFAALWTELEVIVERARHGDFAGVPRVLDLYDAGGPELRFVCCKVLGDVGTGECFARMRDGLTEADSDRTLDYIHAFHERGLLSDIPTLVDEYDKFFCFEGAAVIPLFLSDLLEPAWGPIAERPPEDDLDGWEAMVLSHHSSLEQRLGSPDLPVRHGEIFSVARLALRMLERLPSDHETAVFHYKARRLFEANTGVDCTPFYRGGQFQALQAAMILERFLAGPDAHRYEDGVRYFFGHRIPK